MGPPPSDPQDVRHERDLYRQLLELGQEDNVERLLQHALQLIVSLARANTGYIELRSPYAADAPRQWMTHGLGHEADGSTFQEAISSGVIQSALAAGETIITASAVTDPRFRDRQSVKNRKIEAVLCAPVGNTPALGVVYLQGRSEAGPFSEADRSRTELCAHQIASLADRLFLRRDRIVDPTERWRAKLDCPDLVGQSKALARTLEQVALAAPLDVSILLSGATGTGKSHIARVIHRNSRRADADFVELNCATLPDNLIESELFGAAKGAYTGVDRAREGKVAAAEGGTLFLDEVSELSIAAQAKLLQLLQSREYYPLGSTHKRSADVRVIAATNVDLDQAMRERTFREDLYYRLKVLPIRIPSLVERSEDIVHLAQHACEHACDRHGLPNLSLSAGALHALEAAQWPGNIRQLRHVVEAATIRAAGHSASRIEPAHLFPDGDAQDDPAAWTFQQATRDFHRKLLKRVLSEEQWNVSATAKRLDVARSHLYTLISGLDIERD